MSTFASTLMYMATTTTTVRVRTATRDSLARMSANLGLSTADLLAEIVERREQDDVLERMNDAYARQLASVDSRGTEAGDRSAWEATLLDGLGRL